MELTTVISAISQLPDSFLKSDTEESEFYQGYVQDLKFQYRSVGLWLAYYLLEKEELYKILILPDVGYYKPMAEMVWLDYKFLQEIKLLSPEFQERNIIDFLYLLQREDLDKGVLSNSFNPKNPKGKRQAYQLVLAREKAYIDVDSLECLGNKITYSPREKMLNTAIEIALHPDNKLFKSLYRKYLRDLTRCQNTIRNTPEFQTVFLCENKMKISGDGKRVKPPKRTGQGFKKSEL
ncbi:MAG: hypothetical protein ACR2LR_08310 [Hassallia sp.]